nr:hypothetical protein [uncultured Draconibacterium sp.]
MPFIKISTLPNSLNKAEIMKSVENALYTYEFEGKELMPENMATCIWQTQDCVVHKLEAYVEYDPGLVEIPVFVDLYVNTVFSKEKVAVIMEIVGAELSKGTGIDPKYVFIHTHVGNPGYVFINGEVWNG